LRVAACGVYRNFTDQMAEGSLDFIIRGKFASLYLRDPFEHRCQMGRIDRLGRSFYFD
jgi:hypothetical protein